jgi:hypothetical protein
MIIRPLATFRTITSSTQFPAMASPGSSDEGTPLAWCSWLRNIHNVPSHHSLVHPSSIMSAALIARNFSRRLAGSGLLQSARVAPQLGAIRFSSYYTPGALYRYDVHDSSQLVSKLIHGSYCPKFQPTNMSRLMERLEPVALPTLPKPLWVTLCL